MKHTDLFQKTKMCKFHILGMCSKGEGCQFAHTKDELAALPDLFRTKLCKTLINTGVCEDPECKYAHNREELRTNSVFRAGRKAANSDNRAGGQLDASEHSPRGSGHDSGAAGLSAIGGNQAKKPQKSRKQKPVRQSPIDEEQLQQQHEELQQQREQLLKDQQHLQRFLQQQQQRLQQQQQLQQQPKQFNKQPQQLDGQLEIMDAETQVSVTPPVSPGAAATCKARGAGRGVPSQPSSAPFGMGQVPVGPYPSAGLIHASPLGLNAVSNLAAGYPVTENGQLQASTRRFPGRGSSCSSSSDTEFGGPQNVGSFGSNLTETPPPSHLHGGSRQGSFGIGVKKAAPYEITSQADEAAGRSGHPIQSSSEVATYSEQLPQVSGPSEMLVAAAHAAGSDGCTVKK